MNDIRAIFCDDHGMVSWTFRWYVSMHRFVILVHDHPSLHWDLLLESGKSCRTWRLLADPELMSTAIQAEKLPDHRLMYLDYEGPISGGRGTVVRWDAGTFEWLIDESGHCEVSLNGQRWRGRMQLQQAERDLWICSRGS